MSQYITDNIKIPSDFDEKNSDAETSDEESFDEENFDKKNIFKDTLMVKLIFKAYKKTVFLFKNCFSYICFKNSS